MVDTEYDNLKHLSIEQLARKIAGGSAGSSIEMAKLVYNEQIIDRQHEYAKQQIEHQHVRNVELLKKQLRWIKFSAILNCIALLAAVLLGWFLQEWKSKPIPFPSAQQNIQSQKEPSQLPNLATDSERKNDIVPYKPHR